MVKLTQLVLLVATCQASVINYNRRGLSLNDVNSPQINQQQSIETDEGFGFAGEDGGEFGFGSRGNGDNTMSFNSFNNVGGVTKTQAPAFNNGLGLFGGLLFRRNLNLDHMASPEVFMMQSIEGMGPVGVAPTNQIDSDSPFAKISNFGSFGNPKTFLN